LTIPNSSKQKLVKTVVLLGHLPLVVPILFFTNLVVMTLIYHHCIGRAPDWISDSKAVESSVWGPVYLALEGFDDFVLDHIDQPYLYLLIPLSFVAAPILTRLFWRDCLPFSVCFVVVSFWSILLFLLLAWFPGPLRWYIA
jgi:hypothetical protein